MACSVPHSDDEIQALIQKLFDEDMVHQKAILDLALQFDNACTTKDDLKKAYEKCNHIPQESRALIDTFLKEGGSSSQTHEICDVFLTEKELHQLHLDEAALRETIEKQAMDEKAREDKIRQKQADGDEFFLEFEKVIEDVGEDDDFKSGAWVSATNYVNAYGGTVTGCLGDIENNLKKRKLEQVVAIVKSCSLNVLGDLTVTMKDLPGAAMILANVSVFSPKPSMHYLNITRRNVVKVFRKDTVSGSGSG
uniref:Homologous recombination OB-fold protein OB-fold domain-containing protein n=1 Tax=Tanacetum cinerariifolium TaxID=118510 RepID=A0A699I2C2_TANCI|nr:hypothetical protein [Tanacetum cinerariifolium]